MEFTISAGFDPQERAAVAVLFWQAFGPKLHILLGPPDKALAFLSAQVNPDFALVARTNDGRLVGLAGFKTSDGALVGGELADLAAIYGWLSTLWRAPLLALIERDLDSGVLLMDGISVDATMQGQGVGTALLNAIKVEALRRGATAIRLDVIDTNPRARALYARQGFEATGTEQLGPLRWIFGFRSSTKMICRLR
jgi:ribosomal protein S18 acetylase RimI-like enzyme